MQPATFDFEIRPGDTETLAVILETVNVITGETYGLDYAHHVAAWSITRNGATVTRTTAPGGDLVPDRETKVLEWKLSATETQAYADGKAATHEIVVTASDGTVQTFLTGRIIPRLT